MKLVNPENIALKIAGPDSIIDSGINKGYSYGIAYKYVPDYLERIVLTDKKIYFLIEKFEKLDRPSPFYYDPVITSFFCKSYTSHVNNLYSSAREVFSIEFALEVMRKYKIQPKPSFLLLKDFANTIKEETERYMMTERPLILCDIENHPLYGFTKMMKEINDLKLLGK